MIQAPLVCSTERQEIAMKQKLIQKIIDSKKASGCKAKCCLVVKYQ